MENELKELLRSKAEEMHLATEIPGQVARRARRHRLANGVVAASVAGALAVGSFLAVRASVGTNPVTPGLPSPSGLRVGPTPTESRGPGESSPSPTQRTSPSPSATPNPEIVAAGFPSTFVALDPHDGVVVLDTATEQVLRTLVSSAMLATEAVEGLMVSPDRTTVFVWVNEDSGRSSILSVPIGGGDLTDVASGYGPVLSRDGEHLAYAGCDESSCGTRLVVRTLATGEEAIWPVTESDVPEVILGPLAWVGDPHHLAVTIYPGGDSDSFVSVLDTTQTAAVLADLPKLGPKGRGGWNAVGYETEGRSLVVGSYCCYPNYSEGSLLSVDPDTDEVLGTLLAGYRDAEIDSSGTQYLLPYADGLVLGWNRSLEGPVVIADGYFVPAW